ncbi:MAG: DUF4838 domain-containing protein, partial [Armatimonadetes bacterium]|nr:DUF4838 domain-containing protein [Armatimonadota bacterium]
PAGSGLYSGYHWGENYFAVEPMDNSSFCKCDLCQAWLDPKEEGPQDVYSSGRHSDYFFNFVNEVAKEVRKTHPDKRVVTLAYMTHAYPPKKLRLEPNVVVMYCFASNRLVYDKKEYANDLNALREWVKQYSDRPMYLWLYYTFPVEVANNGQWFCFPGYFAHKIEEQMKLFRKYKMGGMFHCGYGQEVEAYVSYRLMDDPTLKVDALLDEYFRRYYGGAAGPMKKLYLAIEKTYCDPKSYPPGYHGHESKLIAWNSLGTEGRMAQFGKLMAQARSLAVTEEEKERMKLFDMATWSYMVAGQQQHLAHKNAPIPSVQVPRVGEAQGDPAKVDWKKSVALGGSWYDRGQDQPADRRLSGRIAHDGRFLYMELTDPCDTAKLSASPTVFCYDDWEIFVAAQRAEPYRQYAVGPTGLTIALSHGEVNFRRNVEMPGYPLKVVPDTSAADRWISRLAFPLADLVKGGVRTGGRFYMNILRVSGPEIAKKGGIGIDTWISYCSVHDVDRLGEVQLLE